MQGTRCMITQMERGLGLPRVSTTSRPRCSLTTLTCCFYISIWALGRSFLSLHFFRRRSRNVSASYSSPCVGRYANPFLDRRDGFCVCLYMCFSVNVNLNATSLFPSSHDQIVTPRESKYASISGASRSTKSQWGACGYLSRPERLRLNGLGRM